MATGITRREVMCLLAGAGIGSLLPGMFGSNPEAKPVTQVVLGGQLVREHSDVMAAAEYDLMVYGTAIVSIRSDGKGCAVVEHVPVQGAAE